MYASHYAQHLRDGDDRSGVQGGPGDGELRLPGDADGQGHLLHLVHVYASQSFVGCVLLLLVRH